MNRTVQTRWVAIGAAIAVSLGAGGIGLAGAASSDAAPGLTPITACRLVDTRPDFQVGPRTSPLGPADTYTVAAEGEQGECNLPVTATALALNVTAVDATLDTFLTLWDDGELPNASSLNPAPGQSPTPNAVTVPLTDNGTFNIYNFQGNVHVVIDVVGYHQPHDHDDRYYTEAETDQALATKANISDVYTRNQIDSRWSTRVVAQGFVSPADADPIRELDTAPRVGVTGSVVSAGRFELTFTGVDTEDVPIVMVVPQRLAGRGSCNTNLLQTLSASEYRVRISCYDANDDLATTPFQFLVTD